tara:strand:- start:142542 stop:142877 length:336 start_codon:yes stop_codon:yes gene_type:complete
MAISHAAPGEIISLRPLGDSIASTKTHSLFKTEKMEAIRLVLPEGKKIAEHQAPGEITVHCLEGAVIFSIGDTSRELATGDMLYLEAGKRHAVEAVKDSSVLVTILLNKAN